MIELNSTANVLIPRTEDGRWQTMHAIYRQCIRDEVESALETGNGSVRALLSRISVEVISEAELRLHDPYLDSLFSLNSVNDLERALACSGRKKVDTGRRTIP
jgi:molybdopterin-guanine dinucleotide biosynthesis protein A